VVFERLQIAQVPRARPELAEDLPAHWAVEQWGNMLATGFRLRSYCIDAAWIHRFGQLLAHEIQRPAPCPRRGASCVRFQHTVRLAPDPTLIEIAVTAADGETNRFYRELQQTPTDG
jgi:hypothetical protein